MQRCCETCQLGWPISLRMAPKAELAHTEVSNISYPIQKDRRKTGELRNIRNLLRATLRLLMGAATEQEPLHLDLA